MKSFALLFLFLQGRPIFSAIPQKGVHQELLIHGKVPNFIEVSNKDFLNGFDLRPIHYKEPIVQDLLDYHQKYNRLVKLCSKNLSMLERESLAKEYLEEEESMAPNIRSGGLLDDWEYTI